MHKCTINYKPVEYYHTMAFNWVKSYVGYVGSYFSPPEASPAEERVIDDPRNLYPSYYAKYDMVSAKTEKANNHVIPPESRKEQFQTVFIVDITSSTGPLIKEVRESVALKYGDEIAIVAYRDFSDRVQFETLDFTSDIVVVDDFLNALLPFGGGDTPEDAKGGFIHALYTLKGWRDGTRKLIYWVSDAPPHGFGDGNVDDYPECDKSEWNLIKKEIEQRGIHLVCHKCTKQFEKINMFTEYMDMRGPIASSC